ncbi:MAG: thymidylate synthase [Hydrococcus sp. C42_A2020_068]|uniref:thymidylate synthase n=1 Tax=Pleurocapsa sp. PCC 7327 TaxID=118163 RepID=UPI00029FD458|nr:thymidylate synthase [Pleurocapsa sp. PCC 7327]AFY76620.1 thymidylate synthase [Pleurocapsa sp. PCC 7327]MBF2021632.1 thymidylate synthase [Hydrococcus sp. C42_A2020_068]
MIVEKQTSIVFNYIPCEQFNQLICGYGQTAVITGWTVRQSVTKHLIPEEFAVVGNLYSATRGISPLIRNLLKNPHVRFLVILNATKEDKNSGSCECLLDFFRQGFTKGKSDTGRECWVINSKIRGYIDIEIPDSILEKLRQSLQWEEAKSIAQAVNFVKSYASRSPVEPWGDPLDNFPKVEIHPAILPGYRYGHRIEGETIAETWVKILHRIKTTGTIRPSQYGRWQELIDLVAIVTKEPADLYFPNPNYLPVEREFIGDYRSQMLDDAPIREGVKYTYGQRLRSWFGRDQIEQAIEKLATEKDSSRAVMSLWDVQDYENNDSPPCLNHIWLRIVDDELSLTATFRSNDMFSAWVANAMGLRALQQHIQEQINHKTDYSLKIGPLITVSQSAHIYDDCWEYADRIIQTEYPKICSSRNFDDPSGSFVINIKDREIIVEHLTPGSGEVVNCYSGKSARSIYQQIAADCPSLQVEHAMYLGTELQKAEIALSSPQSLVYTQDRPLKVQN